MISLKNILTQSNVIWDDQVLCKGNSTDSACILLSSIDRPIIKIIIRKKGVN